MAALGDHDHEHDEFSELTLAELPFDCIFCICEFLTSKDLARFSATCRYFHDVSMAESLWRNQVLRHWQFGDIYQVPSGPGRWRRYFMARKKVETRLEQGRPGRDYQVTTLRGHKAKITSCVCLGGSSVDWEQLVPPLIVSLAEDGTVMAWDAKQGKSVWTLEDGGNTCLAANDKENEIAVGSSAGHVTVYNTSDWSTRCVLAPPTGNKVLTLQYGCIRSKSDHTFLLVSSVQDSDGVITLWDVATNPDAPLTLLSPNDCCNTLTVSQSGWLAAVSMDSTEIYVWDLTRLTPSSPLSPSPPLTTLHPTGDQVTKPIWIRPGLLATYSSFFLFPVYRHFANDNSSSLQLWDIVQHLKEGRSQLAYQQGHMYSAQSVNLEAPPTTAAYCNGVLVMGDAAGTVRIVDPMTGTSLQKFSDHKGPVTDLHVDGFRVLSCSKDYSIRVYKWVWSDGSGVTTPQLHSRYQLLGGSVALKKHDGFHQVTCEAGSCVGVAGDVIKLYTFFHQLEQT